MLHLKTLEFLQWLSDFNDKKFFDLYRPLYDQIRKDFVVLTQNLIKNISKFDDTVSGVLPKECIFRINRDTRFWNDKTPYKNNLGANIAMGGKKTSLPAGQAGLAGYYVHIQPGGKSFFGSGIYMASTKTAGAIREAIYKDFSVFKKIISSAKFKSVLGKIHSYHPDLKVIPKRFSKSHPSVPYIKMRDRLVMVPLKDKEVLAPDFEKKILELSKIAYPFNKFLDGVVLELKKRGIIISSYPW